MNRLFVKCIQSLLFEDGWVQLLCVGAHSISLHLVFRDHKFILVGSWFFLDSHYHYQCSDLVCLDRECAEVQSRCGLLVSMRTSFVFVRPAQSVEVCIDLGFFGLKSFWILYVLYTNDLLAEYIQGLACKDGTVQLVWVLVHLWALSYLVFGGHEATLIGSWFFLDS